MILWMRLSVGKSGGFLYMINQRLYSTLYIQQTVTYTRLYRVCHQYLTDNARVVGNKWEIFWCNETREILLKIDYGQWTTVQLITYAYTQTCASRLGWLC